MPTGIPTTCTHARRPGTTVCLYCLEEARAKARSRRNRVLTRAALFTVGGGVALSLIVGAVSALRSGSPGLPGKVDSAAGVSQSGDAAESPPARTTRGLAPIVPDGRTQLGDSMVAQRQGDTVVVNFDTELLRTRFDWKFEGVIRATLGMVYGEPAKRALEAIPQGEFVRGDIIQGSIARRGVELELAGDAGSLRIWPVTRPGRDGPIAIAYRAIAVR